MIDIYVQQVRFKPLAMATSSGIWGAAPAGSVY
jgi:hypothetical protein